MRLVKADGVGNAHSAIDTRHDMIPGIGPDLANIDRIADTPERFGNHVSTESERHMAECLASKTPPGHNAIIHITVADDHPWAQAFVEIEARA